MSARYDTPCIYCGDASPITEDWWCCELDRKPTNDCGFVCPTSTCRAKAIADGATVGTDDMEVDQQDMTWRTGP